MFFKAHLEKVLRDEIEEKNIKIETLNTKINLLQETPKGHSLNIENGIHTDVNDAPLINLSVDNENNQTNDDTSASEIAALNTKIEKLEILVNKYKESLKSTKEKNSQITTELQLVTSELASKNKEIEQFQITIKQLDETRQKVQELNDLNEDLQNKVNAYDFNKTKQMSTLEIDLNKAQEEITELQKKIEVFTKREEEYAISLAENKLRIHKELESKETEIKSLKDSLSNANTEIQSLNIVIGDYKSSIAQLEEEKLKLKNDINELGSANKKLTETESQLQTLIQKCQSLENSKSKADEEYNCLQLQLKQETAEKLAMIDRNGYLEDRNSQLSEDNTKKSQQINNLDKELDILKKERSSEKENTSEKLEMLAEIQKWKNKCSDLESEIQEEREELGKLQSEIEKLLSNHELIQKMNTELNTAVNSLKTENEMLKSKVENYSKIKGSFINLGHRVKDLQTVILDISQEARALKEINKDIVPNIQQSITLLLNNVHQTNELVDIQSLCDKYKTDYEMTCSELKNISEQHSHITRDLQTLQIENEKLKSHLNSHENMQSELTKLSERLLNITKEKDDLQKENEKLQSEISAYELTRTELKKISDQHLDKIKELDILQKENDKLKTDIKTFETENNDLSEKIEYILTQHDISLEEVKSAQKEKQELINKFEEFKIKYQQLQVKLENDSDQRQTLKQNIQEMGVKILEAEKENKSLNIELDILRKLQENYCLMVEKVTNVEEENILLNTEITKIKKLNADSSVLMDKLKNMEDENISLKTESDNLRKEYKDTSSKLNQLIEIENEKNKLEAANNTLKREKEDLISKINDMIGEKDSLHEKLKSMEKNLSYIEKLENKVRDLTQENITLKSQCETIANNVKSLQSELSDVRKSHAEIEVEKDRLCSVIEQLETNEQINKPIENITQTNVNVEQEPVEEIVELKPLKELNIGRFGQKNGDGELYIKYNGLLAEHNTLKEDNRRLQSDISGLQTYLAQISKENSVLNDQMRELIASGEGSTDRSLSDLKNELHSGREKMNDLIRENSLLIEENLELKDQLSSQNHYKPAECQPNNAVKESEIMNWKEKYDNLHNINDMLEKRLNDVELMNISVNNSMQQVQDTNNKLRLSNEKLERRLDEALVSLRHLHSLQENTELEYLRNILYEYLTGSGTHSVTLAKVLSAVVKFDDAQTRQVLQKEKERQGFVSTLISYD